jgi:putative acetyltransferase
MTIDELRLEDYDDALALWKSAEGIGLSSADSREAIGRYLLRNPGMSSAARSGGRLVGAVLAGHDGRRGFLHHLAVAADRRGRGLGRVLVERSLERLRGEGIAKCHIFLMKSNEKGRGFWEAVGWQPRSDIGVCSRSLEGEEPPARRATGA